MTSPPNESGPGPSKVAVVCPPCGSDSVARTGSDAVRVLVSMSVGERKTRAIERLVYLGLSHADAVEIVWSFDNVNQFTALVLLIGRDFSPPTSMRFLKDHGYWQPQPAQQPSGPIRCHGCRQEIGARTVCSYTHQGGHPIRWWCQRCSA